MDSVSNHTTTFHSWKFIRKTFQYTIKDRRKLISLLIVLFLPVVSNSWRLIPNGIPFYYYHDLSVFVYMFGLNLLVMMVAIAWFLILPRRDFALQIFALAAVFYGLFITLDTLPFTDSTPVWLDILISTIPFLIICVYLYYVHRNFIHQKIDHKQLYEGLLHDLHHQRLLNTVSRVEGLISIAEIEEPYRSMCREEIQKMKEGISFLSEKYSDLK